MQMSCDCGKKFLVDSMQRGSIVKCPTCRKEVRVPDDRGGRTVAHPVPATVEPLPEPADDLTVFECPACGNTMKAREAYAGRATRCPKCQESVTIPGKGAAQSPRAKKSSAALIIGIAAGFLLLIGGLIVALMLGGKDKGGLGDRPEIDDLTLVPANAQLIVCVKMDAVWQTPSVQKSVGESRRTKSDKPDPGQRLETETGLKPEQIERSTTVVPSVNKEGGWTVFKTKAPYDAKALGSRIREPKQKSHLDRPYVVGLDSQNQPIACAPVSPTVFVLGKEEGVRQALGMVGTSAAPGPLTSLIEACRKPDHVVFGYNSASGRAEGNRGGFDLSSLNDLELLRGTLNIREQAELDARAATDSDANAEKLRGTTAGWLRTVKTGLAFAQFLPGEQGAEAAQKSKLINAIKLSTDGKDVVATLRADADIVVPLLLGAMR